MDSLNYKSLHFSLESGSQPASPSSLLVSAHLASQPWGSKLTLARHSIYTCAGSCSLVFTLFLQTVSPTEPSLCPHPREIFFFFLIERKNFGH